MHELLARMARQQRRKLVVLCELCLIAVVLSPRLAATAFVNVGSVAFARAVSASVTASEYPHWNVVERARMEPARNAFERALRIVPGDATAQWGRARVALAEGDATAAIQRLLPHSPEVMREPLRFMDALVAWSRAGHDDVVLELNSAGPPLHPIARLADTVALVYEHRAEALSARGEPGADQVWWRRVADLRPFDLCANLQLWQAANARGDRAQAQLHAQRLRRFESEAADPTDERLLECALSAVPVLLASELWEPRRAKNAVSFWVWRHPDMPKLGSALHDLATQWPADPYWVFLQGERHHRMFEVAEARRYYQKALDLQPEFGPAAQRLVQLEARPTSRPSTGDGDDELAAQMLEVPAATVRLGPNLMPGDTLASAAHGAPAGWLHDSVAAPADGLAKWPFAIGRDSIEPPGSLRIVNLLWPETDTSAGHTAYAEMWNGGPAFGQGAAWSMVTLRFKVEGDPTSAGRGLVYLMGSDKVRVSPLVFLSDTGGQWKKLAVIGWLPEVHSNPFIYLRNYGAASVWFHDVAFRRLELSATPKACVADACVAIRSVLD